MGADLGEQSVFVALKRQLEPADVRTQDLSPSTLDHPTSHENRASSGQ